MIADAFQVYKSSSSTFIMHLTCQNKYIMIKLTVATLNKRYCV